MSLAVRDVTRSLGGTVIIDGIDLDVAEGSVVGLIGPNGSGKTTLLRTIAALGRPDTGTIGLGDEDLLALTRKHLGRRLALVEQQATTEVDLTVLDVVLLGRTPYRRPLQGDSGTDLALALAALDRVALSAFAERRWRTLSGGEQQRAHLARALVQQPRLLLLDEPTNHLDIGHQLQLLALVRDSGLTTLAALHDLNLAALFCDALVVLHRGRVHAAGPVGSVLTPELLGEVYLVLAEVAAHPGTGRPQVVLHPPTPAHLPPPDHPLPKPQRPTTDPPDPLTTITPIGAPMTAATSPAHVPAVIPVPPLGWLLAAVGLIAIYLVLQENGALLANSWETLHELFHDGRHALGVPCH